MKIVNRTCDIFLLLPAFLFFCCVCVADQNTRALLLHAYCYCLATRRLAVTHHPTYTQHEKREAKEKWQRRQTVENRTFAWNQLQMVTNIPDLPILKMLIKIFGYFWVIQVWSVGPLRASLFPSDMSISSSLSLSCCRFEMQVSTLQSRTFFKCIQLSKKRNPLNLGSTLALNQQFQCFLLYFLSTI